MDDIVRFPSAVRHEPAIDAWLRSRRDDLRPFVETWFARMRRCGDDVRELMHDGCPTACVGDAAFGYVNAFKDHVKLRPGREIDAAALARLPRRWARRRTPHEGTPERVRSSPQAPGYYLQIPPEQNKPDRQGGSDGKPQNAPGPPGGLQMPPAQNKPDPQGGSDGKPQNAPGPPGDLQMPPAQNVPEGQGGSDGKPQNAFVSAPGSTSADSSLVTFGALSSSRPCSMPVHAVHILNTNITNIFFIYVS